MKRIQSACICQTLHFMLKEELPHDEALRQLTHEVAHYKETLERNRVTYRILEETPLEDGSIIVKVIKQYNQSPVGDYLN